MKEEGACEGQATVEIHDPDLCYRYAARIVKDVRIEPSPGWMQERLKASGVSRLITLLI